MNAGAIVAGPKPVDSPSLADDQPEFQTLAAELWGSCTGEHAFGKGKVYANQNAATELSPNRDQATAGIKIIGKNMIPEAR